MDAFLWPHIDQNRAILPRLARRAEARGPRRVDAPDNTRPVSCSSGRSRQLAPDPVLARAASALKASLALGKLYQSTDRLAEADAVLAAALEGFSPTPEMPEIAEAQALVERLAQCRFGL
jgi:hypothetical protein